MINQEFGIDGEDSGGIGTSSGRIDDLSRVSIGGVPLPPFRPFGSRKAEPPPVRTLHEMLKSLNPDPGGPASHGKLKFGAITLNETRSEAANLLNSIPSGLLIGDVQAIVVELLEMLNDVWARELGIESKEKRLALAAKTYMTRMLIHLEPEEVEDALNSAAEMYGQVINM